MNYRICVLLLVCGCTASAGTITLDPSDGVITGSPGSTIGWGFTVNADPGYLTTFITSFTLFETNPSIGFYTDFIGAQGGPQDFSLPAGAPDWVETFDPVQQTGIGSFTIDPAALPGAADSGVIHIEYQLILASMSLPCDTNCGASTLASSDCGASCFGSVEVPFEVTASAPTPEPGTCLLEFVGLALLLIGKTRRTGGPPRRKPR
jgi:hypothetical protein